MTMDPEAFAFSSVPPSCAKTQALADASKATTANILFMVQFRSRLAAEQACRAAVGDPWIGSALGLLSCQVVQARAQRAIQDVDAAIDLRLGGRQRRGQPPHPAPVRAG